MTAKASYGTYGELLGVVDAVSGEQLEERTGALGFLYNAQFGIRTDADGLYYMRARYYSPDSKRFITLDPVKGELTNTQSLNRYAYVQGKPISAIDPLGLSPLLNLARLLPDVETMLNIARVLPVTGTIMGVYGLYQGVKEKNAKKSITAAACLGFGAFAGIGKGIKFLNKAGKISDKAAGLLQATGNAVATAYQAELFCESLSNAGEELSTNGKISTGTLADMAITGLSTYLFGKATIKSIPRRAPEKLKTGAAGTGKTKTTAAKELAGEMPAVNGKVDGGSGVVRRKGGLELDLQFFASDKSSKEINGTSYDINKLKKTQPYTYPDGIEKYKNQILSDGPNSIEPIPIRIHNGEALIVDGHHRYEVFKQLGYERVPIKYLHKSNLGKSLPNGDYYRTLEQLLRDKIN